MASATLEHLLERSRTRFRRRLFETAKSRTEENELDRNLERARVRAEKGKGREYSKARRAAQVTDYYEREAKEMQRSIDRLANGVFKIKLERAQPFPRHLRLKAATERRLLGDPIRLHTDRVRPSLGAPVRVSEDMRRLKEALVKKRVAEREASAAKAALLTQRPAFVVYKDYKEPTPALGPTTHTKRSLEVQKRALLALPTPGTLELRAGKSLNQTEIRHGTRLGDYEKTHRVPQADLPNKYRHAVEISMICIFCGDEEEGAPTHYRKWNCKVYLDYLRSIPADAPDRESKIAHQTFCPFPGCKEPRSHTLPACRTLHRYCAGCRSRGHAPGQCPKTDGDKAALKSRFDRYKRFGVYTKRGGDWDFAGPALDRSELRYCRVLGSKLFMAWYSRTSPFPPGLTEDEQVLYLRAQIWK